MKTDHVPFYQSPPPYSIMHIGIGSWLGPYVVFMMTDHVTYHQSIPPSPILNHAYWYWVLAWAICCFHDDRPCTILSKHTYITHTQSRILVLGLGTCHVLFHDDRPCNILSKHHPYSITHIGIGSWSGPCVIS